MPIDVVNMDPRSCQAELALSRSFFADANMVVIVAIEHRADVYRQR